MVARATGGGRVENDRARLGRRILAPLPRRARTWILIYEALNASLVTPQLGCRESLLRTPPLLGAEAARAHQCITTKSAASHNSALVPPRRFLAAGPLSTCCLRDRSLSHGNSRAALSAGRAPPATPRSLLTWSRS